MALVRCAACYYFFTRREETQRCVGKRNSDCQYGDCVCPPQVQNVPLEHFFDDSMAIDVEICFKTNTSEGMESYKHYAPIYIDEWKRFKAHPACVAKVSPLSIRSV